MEDGNVKIDSTCLVVLLMFLVGNIIKFLSWLTFDATNKDFSYRSWTSLDPDYLKQSFESKSSRFIFDDVVSLLSSISFVALFVPIFQVSWMLSHGGNHRTINHLFIFLLCVSGGLSELMASLMMTGLRHTLHWSSKSVVDWGLRQGDTSYDDEIHTDDGVGWRSLEIVYMMNIGLVTWVDAFE